MQYLYRWFHTNGPFPTIEESQKIPSHGIFTFLSFVIARMGGRTNNSFKFPFYHFSTKLKYPLKAGISVLCCACMLLGLSGTTDVATFRNLGGDARLVAPYRAGNYDYTHLASFVRSAPMEQARARTKDCSSSMSPIALLHVVRADASFSLDPCYGA